MKVLICGDRDWTNREVIKNVIIKLKEKYKSKLAIVEGDARGADRISGEIVTELGIALFKCPANWLVYYKSAGPIRNRWQADFFLPDLTLGFHNNIEKSAGTKDMLNYSVKMGIKTIIIDEGGRQQLYGDAPK